MIYLFLLLPFWALSAVSQGWNTKELALLYHHHSEMQAGWALETLSHHTFKGDETVLDFGCGDGKLSALIARLLVPKGKVFGMDLSPSMTSFASKMFPNEHYHNLVFSPVNFDQQYDIITSFCVFHLVPNAFNTFKIMRSHLKPDGKLIVTYPMSANEEFYAVIRQEMEKRGLKFPTRSEETSMIRNPLKARQLLEDAGFTIDHFEVVKTHDTFSSKEEFIAWCEGTLPGNFALPPEEIHSFCHDFVEGYLKQRPQDIAEDGFVSLSQLRLEFVASNR